MDQTALLYEGLIFGSIGLSFFIYGKKQHKIVPLLTGIALMVFPYFIVNQTLLIIVSMVLVMLPLILKR